MYVLIVLYLINSASDSYLSNIVKKTMLPVKTASDRTGIGKADILVLLI